MNQRKRVSAFIHSFIFYMKKKDYTVTVIVVVGLFVLTMMLIAAIAPEEPSLGKITVSRKAPSAAPAAYDGRAHIKVIDQSITDKALILSFAVKENSFAVIRREEKGKPGEIIGISKVLSPGLYSNRWISLSESVAPGDLLLAMLYTDNGDGIFNDTNDALLKGDETTVSDSGTASFMAI